MRRRSFHHKICVTEYEVIWRGERYRLIDFIRRVFYYLHARTRLLERSDYRRLYEECLEIQVEHLLRFDQAGRTPETYREMTLALANESVKNHGKNAALISRSAVKAYLDYRYDVWEAGGLR